MRGLRIYKLSYGKNYYRTSFRRAKMLFTPKKSIIDINDKCAQVNFSRYFRYHVISNMDDTYRNLVFLCIGTDRSTGDSLGPIVGYKLSSMSYDNVCVFGTLDEPVHAKNLSAKVEEIRSIFVNPFIIAVDACLGHQENIGHINISNGPIYPGAGVNKSLLPIGDINITGVVNASGYMEYFVLQNTRLNLVMKMAEIITGGILYSIDDILRRIPAQYMEV
jgi:putative sporulation protein YyaC